MSFQPAVNFTDFFPEMGTVYRFLGTEPLQSPVTSFLRALWIAADPLPGDPSHYWTLGIGVWSPAGYAERVAFPYVGGFPRGPQRVSLTPEIGADRGAPLALRVTPSSPDTTPLTGLSVIPEWADTGALAQRG